MSIVEKIQEATAKALMHLYNQPFTLADFQVNQTKEEFEGDYTVVLLSQLKKKAEKPASQGEKIGK